MSGEQDAPIGISLLVSGELADLLLEQVALVRQWPIVIELGSEVTPNTVARMAFVRGLKAMQGQPPQAQPESAKQPTPGAKPQEIKAEVDEDGMMLNPPGWALEKSLPSVMMPTQGEAHKYYAEHGWNRYWLARKGAPTRYFYWSPDPARQEGVEIFGDLVVSSVAEWGVAHMIRPPVKEVTGGITGSLQGKITTSTG